MGVDVADVPKAPVRELPVSEIRVSHRTARKYIDHGDTGRGCRPFVEMYAEVTATASRRMVPDAVEALQRTVAVVSEVEVQALRQLQEQLRGSVVKRREVVGPDGQVRQGIVDRHPKALRPKDVAAWSELRLSLLGGMDAAMAGKLEVAVMTMIQLVREELDGVLLEHGVPTDRLDEITLRVADRIAAAGEESEH